MPNVLIHRITRQIEYEEFVREIRRFSTFELLCACNRLANWIEANHISDKLVPVPAIPRYKVGRDDAIHIEPSMVAFLAKESLLHGNDNRHAEINRDVLLCLLYLVAALREAPPQNPTRGAAGLLLRTYEQQRYQTELSRVMPRTRAMLIDGNRTTTPGQKPLDLDEIWIDLTGMTMEKFMMVGFGFYAGALENTRTRSDFPARGVLSDIITGEECQRFLARVGASYGEFGERSRQYRADDSLYVRSEFNALLQRPAILRSREVLVPLPRLLLYRFTEGIFFDIESSLTDKQSGDLHRYFGYLFEQYIGRLLKWAYGERNVFPEQTYTVKRQEWKGPDWIVIDGDTALLFECRSGRVSLEARVYGQEEAIEMDIRRMLTNTVRRFPQKVDHLKSGLLGINLSGVTRFEKVVVVNERVAFEEIVFRSSVREQLAASNYPLVEDYHLIDIEDMETLTAWNAEHPTKDLLLARMEAENPKEDFADFVRRYAIQNTLSPRHPLLHEMVDDLFEMYGMSQKQLQKEGVGLDSPHIAGTRDL